MNPNKRPESRGEFFRFLEYNSDWLPGCFVCRHFWGIHRCIVASVESEEAAKRTVTMIGYGAGWTTKEPGGVKVKVSACDKHQPNLQKLETMVKTDGIITVDRITEAQNLTPADVVT